MICINHNIGDFEYAIQDIRKDPKFGKPISESILRIGLINSIEIVQYT